MECGCELAREVAPGCRVWLEPDSAPGKEPELEEWDRRLLRLRRTFKVVGRPVRKQASSGVLSAVVESKLPMRRSRASIPEQNEICQMNKIWSIFVHLCLCLCVLCV